MSDERVNILLVEDSEDDYIITRGLLAEGMSGNFRLQWASSLETALEALGNCIPDILLVDYDLGMTTGLDFLRAAQERNFHIPAILLTGYSSYALDVEAMKTGAADYLEKGAMNGPMLERAIRYAIERQQITSRLEQLNGELERRVAERTRALTETNELFEQIFSTIYLMIAYIDRDFNFIRVNRKYAEADGRPEAFFTGKNHFELYPNAENEAIFRRVVETGEAFFVFARPFVYPDHPERGVTYWDWSLQPVKEPDGTVTSLILSMVDVTEQQRIRAELSEIKGRLIDAAEAERLELARELHDGPIQDMYGLSLQLRMLESDLVDGANNGTLAGLQASLQHVINTLRATSVALRPPSLTKFGLQAAIRSHCEQFHKMQPGLEIQLDLADDHLALPERERLALFRIYQVALTNVARHAHARQVVIRLKSGEQNHILEIQDDGVGFQVPRRWVELARQGHLGLVGAIERAESLGGHLQVISQPGSGTTIRVTLPQSAS